jgi:hypothetical protein
MATRLCIGEADCQRHAGGQRGTLSADAVGRPYPFAAPPSGAELEDLRWCLEDYLEVPYAVYETLGQTIAARLPAQGERVFASLSGPGTPGAAAYARAREAAVRGACSTWNSPLPGHATEEVERA